MTLYEHFQKPTCLFDSHTHLSAENFTGELDAIVSRSLDASVERIYEMSINVEDAHKSIDLAKAYPDVIHAFIGVDPEVCVPGSDLFQEIDDPDAWLETQYENLILLMSTYSQFIAGIGETGLDHYWLLLNKELDQAIREHSMKLQEDLFRMHLELAHKYKLPLSIHSRGAESRCLEIAKEYNVAGIFHGYTGNYETAAKVLDAGWGLGVNGIATFKNAENIRDIYRRILPSISDAPSPEFFYTKGIYFETDAPWLSPEGKRGQRNEPANIKTIYEQFVRDVL